MHCENSAVRVRMTFHEYACVAQKSTEELLGSLFFCKPLPVPETDMEMLPLYITLLQLWLVGRV